MKSTKPGDRAARWPRPSAAMMIACLALVLAAGGVSYAAFFLPKNSVKSKHIKNRTVKTKDLNPNLVAPNAARAARAANATNAANAANAARLGGELPSGYVGACEAGAIKGMILFDTQAMAVSNTYTTVGPPFTGFNCTGGAVQIRKTGDGVYNVRFVGTPAGSAVVTVSQEGNPGAWGANYDNVADPQIGNEQVFEVKIFQTNTLVPADDKVFTLLAY